MNTKINNYTKTYDALKHRMKWKVSDKRILMSIASIYTMNDTKLDSEKLLQLADTIKRRASLFSSMRSYPRFTTAAMLDVNFDNSEEKVELLYDYYEQFKRAKFSSGTFTYIAATILLTNHTEHLAVPTTIQTAKNIYDGMKKEHAFLTSSGDYPLATLLAFREREDIIQHMESYYEQLAKNGFRKGNDLQFLSHILSLSEDGNIQTIVNRTMEVADMLLDHGIKTKTTYYPAIGILALLPPEEFDVHQIIDMYEQLNQVKDFKWQKDMNVLMAVSLFVNEKIDHAGLAETSIYTVLETVIQAQQAVMIATIAGATAATSSNSGN
ncbi:DUF4003 family protein [Ornithinibacillus salinisoli]|uniref:DUF4003 family protein n=1 Tax=Ornithinibacillus salinisoli TaxID=1848459 RepID=A0ABW4VYU0_9BACI